VGPQIHKVFRDMFNSLTQGDEKKNKTSSVYDCTVEDVEYIYNALSLLVTLIRHLVVVITLP